MHLVTGQAPFRGLQAPFPGSATVSPTVGSKLHFQGSRLHFQARAHLFTYSGFRASFPGPATVSPCNSAPVAARQKARRWQYVPVSVFRQSQTSRSRFIAACKLKG